MPNCSKPWASKEGKRREAAGEPKMDFKLMLSNCLQQSMTPDLRDAIATVASFAASRGGGGEPGKWIVTTQQRSWMQLMIRVCKGGKGPAKGLRRPRRPGKLPVL